MNLLKRELAKYRIQWLPAFDHTNFISIFDGSNICCRVFKENYYRLTYFGKYRLDEDDPTYSFAYPWELIDHVEDRISKANNKKDVRINFTYADGKTAAEVKSQIDRLYMYSGRSNGKLWTTINNYVESRFTIKDVIFHDPATIVLWNDGSKTVVKCQKGEEFDPEKGLAMAISKKIYGNNYDYYEVFNKYVGRYNKRMKKKEDSKNDT